VTALTENTASIEDTKPKSLSERLWKAARGSFSRSTSQPNQQVEDVETTTYIITDEVAGVHTDTGAGENQRVEESNLDQHYLQQLESHIAADNQKLEQGHQSGDSLYFEQTYQPLDRNQFGVDQREQGLQQSSDSGDQRVAEADNDHFSSFSDKEERVDQNTHTVPKDLEANHLGTTSTPRDSPLRELPEEAPLTMEHLVSKPQAKKGAMDEANRLYDLEEEFRVNEEREDARNQDRLREELYRRNRDSEVERDRAIYSEAKRVRDEEWEREQARHELYMEERSRHEESSTTGKLDVHYSIDEIKRLTLGHIEDAETNRLKEFRTAFRETFSGDEPLQCQRFLNKYNTCADQFEITLKTRCKCFPSFLRGDAENWYHNLDPKIRDRWEEVKKIFVTMFKPPELADHYYDLASARRQRKDESVATYTADIKKYFGSDEAENLRIYIRNMWGPLRKRVRKTSPKNIHQASMTAKANETRLRAERLEQEADKSESTKTSVQAVAIEAVNLLREERLQREAKKAESSAPLVHEAAMEAVKLLSKAGTQASPRQASEDKNFTHVARIRDPHRPTLPRSAMAPQQECWRCGRIGHSKRDCYATTMVDGEPLQSANSQGSHAPSNDLASKWECWRCGRPGHGKRDCWANTTVDGEPLQSSNTGYQNRQATQFQSSRGRDSWRGSSSRGNSRGAVQGGRYTRNYQAQREQHQEARPSRDTQTTDGRNSYQANRGYMVGRQNWQRSTTPQNSSRSYNTQRNNTQQRLN
jgi:hypothetical protein